MKQPTVHRQMWIWLLPLPIVKAIDRLWSYTLTQRSTRMHWECLQIFNTKIRPEDKIEHKQYGQAPFNMWVQLTLSN